MAEFNLQGACTRIYVPVPWGQVHARVAGNKNDPAVVLIHQSPLSSATYEPILESVADQGFYVVALDTPGYGMSDAAPAGWEIAEYGEAVWPVIDELGLQRVALLGQHTGALIALEAYRQRPEAVTKLIFQGLPYYDEEEKAAKLASWAPGYTPKADGSHLLDIWERIYMLYPEETVPRANRQVLEYLAVGPDYGVAYRPVFRYQVDDELVRSAPTAFLMGEGDLLNRMAALMQERFPQAPYLTVANGTDFAQLEEPAEFTRLLVELIK